MLQKKDGEPVNVSTEELPGPSTDPLSITMETVTTAKPTIITRKKPTAPKLGRIPQKEKYDLLNNTGKCLNHQPKKSVPRNSKKTSVKDKGKDGKVKGKTKKPPGCLNVTVPEPESQVSCDTETSLLETKFTITPDLIENLDGFCAVADIVTVTTSTEAEVTEIVDETDEDVDVDIEADDEEPVLFPNRSVSPNSVYKKLLSEANITPEKDDEDASVCVSNLTDASSNNSGDIEQNFSEAPKDNGTCTLVNQLIDSDNKNENQGINNEDNNRISGVNTENLEMGKDSSKTETSVKEESPPKKVLGKINLWQLKCGQIGKEYMI